MRPEHREQEKDRTVALQQNPVSLGGLAAFGSCGVGQPSRGSARSCHVSRDALRLAMIQTFADKRTESLFVTGAAKRVPTDIAVRAARKLEYIHLATTVDDLKVPPGNRLHALKGDRKGQYAIAVNEQWRLCFRFVDGDAYDVEFCDYH